MRLERLKQFWVLMFLALSDLWFHFVCQVDTCKKTNIIYSGGNKDYIIVGSDSGRIVVLEYLPAKNIFNKIHQETFGKTGVRRIVPGQYLAADPKGRAVMIGSH